MQLSSQVLAALDFESSIKQCVILIAFRGMAAQRRLASAWLLLIVLAVVPALGQEQIAAAGGKHAAVLWQDPGDIRAKDLFNGPGGDKRRPELPLKFLKEDTHGHNSKFDAEDAKGKKWKVKLGIEAQPEVVASRLLWAIGYFSNDNYFLRDVPVEDMPPHLTRGQGHVISPGHLDYARLQRRPEGKKKEANWDWRHNPFLGTREFNGLRVMMVLISNWDLKTENNAVFRDRQDDDAYMVSDVGTAFGAAGQRWTEAETKNNLELYRRARFISRATTEYVDFNFPRRSPLLHLVFALPSYIREWRMRWIGNHVPRADAKWVGGLLARLSPEQIQDAFRAAGYSPEQIAGFSQALQARIAELNEL
jgi:hypothetical protein